MNIHNQFTGHPFCLALDGGQLTYLIPLVMRAQLVFGERRHEYKRVSVDLAAYVANLTTWSNPPARKCGRLTGVSVAMQWRYIARFPYGLLFARPPPPPPTHCGAVYLALLRVGHILSFDSICLPVRRVEHWLHRHPSTQSPRQQVFGEPSPPATQTAFQTTTKQSKGYNLKSSCVHR